MTREETAMADVDTGTPPGVTGSADSGTAPPRRGAPLLGLLLVALLVAGGILGMRDRAAQTEPGQRQAALAQARAVATDIVTLGGENAEATLGNLVRGSTGPFREQLTRGTGAFAATLRGSRVTSSGKVAAAGLEEFGPDTARALVVLNGTLANTGVPQGQPVSYRLSLQLRREGGHWLVSGVEVLP